MPAQYQNLQDLMQAQSFLQGQQQYNMQGGAVGAWQQAQKQQAQQQAMNQLNAFLTLQKSYPTMTPNPAMQGAANTMMGSPTQQFQGAMGMPSTQPGVLPQGPAWQSQGTAQVGQTQQLLDYLSGKTPAPGTPGTGAGGGGNIDPTQQYMAGKILGLPVFEPGKLNPTQYASLTQDFSKYTSKEGLSAVKTATGAKTDKEAYEHVSRFLISKYGLGSALNIRRSLGLSASSDASEAMMQWFEDQKGKKE